MITGWGGQKNWIWSTNELVVSFPFSILPPTLRWGLGKLQQKPSSFGSRRGKRTPPIEVKGHLTSSCLYSLFSCTPPYPWQSHSGGFNGSGGSEGLRPPKTLSYFMYYICIHWNHITQCCNVCFWQSQQGGAVSLIFSLPPFSYHLAPDTRSTQQSRVIEGPGFGPEDQQVELQRTGKYWRDRREGMRSGEQQHNSWPHPWTMHMFIYLMLSSI